MKIEKNYDMDIENKKETPRYDKNYITAKNRIDRYGCAKIFKSDKSSEIIEKLKIAFPNHFIWDREGRSFEFVNLDTLIGVLKFKISYLLNFKTDRSKIGSQFILSSDIYNNLIKTLEERNRYDILLKLEI